MRFDCVALLLTFITGVCSEIPCYIVSRFAETSYLSFIEIQLTGCHMMRDQFYIFSFFVYFCFPFVWLLHAYFLSTCLDLLKLTMIFINFNRCFNLYLGNFLIELCFIFIVFILLLIVLLSFWSYSG